MPSGYTACVLEGADFQKFALTCARAFGALVELRDEPLDAPIPETLGGFKSDYHDKQIAEANETLRKIDAMSDEECEEAAQKAYEDDKQSAKAYLDEKQKNALIITEMMNQVAAYEPPTAEHVEYKNFMLRQLKQTLDHDGDTEYARERLSEVTPMTGAEWRQKQIESANWSLSYSREKMTAERENTAGKNQWLQQLRASLAAMPQPAKG